MAPNPNEDSELLDSGFNSPALESPKLDIEGLESIKAEVSAGQSLDLKKDVLFGNVDDFLQADEAELLEEIRSPEVPDSAIKDYLEVGGALHAAEFELLTGSTFNTVTELSDHFATDSDPSTRIYFNVVKALMLENNPTSQAFATEYLPKIMSTGSELAALVKVANEDLNAVVELPGATGELSKARELYESNKPLVHLGIGLALSGAAIWGISRFLKKDKTIETQEKIDKVAGVSGKVLLGGGAVAASGIVIGRMMGKEKADDWIAENMGGFHGSKWHLGILAFGDGRYGDAWNHFWNGKEHTPEEDVQYEVLSNTFDVGGTQLERMAGQDFQNFMSAENSETTPQKRAEASVRAQIRERYEGQIIDHIPAGILAGMTLGEVLQEASNQGFLRPINAPTRTPDANGETEPLPDEANAQRTDRMEERLDSPEGNIEVLHEDAQELLEDLETIEGFSETYIGEVIASAELAINTRFNNSIEDDQEYGDLKIAREQLTHLTEYAKMADHEAFKEMGNSVRGFQDFILEHPHPEQWTATELETFNRLKDKVLRIRKQVDASLAYGNSEHDRAITEDQEDGFGTLNDLSQGAGFGFQLMSGIPLYFEFFYEKAEDGNYYYLAIPLFQAGMAVRANFSNPPKTIGQFTFNTLKGATYDSVVAPGKLLFAEGSYRYAYRYTPKELITMRLEGRISHGDLMRRLKLSDQIAARLAKNSSFTQQLRSVFSRVDVDQMKAFSKGYRENGLNKWISFIDHADDKAIYAQKDVLTQLLKPEEIKRLRELRKLNNLNVPFVESTTLAGGKVRLSVDGRVITEVAAGDAAAAEAQILAEAEKAGKPIKHPRRFAKVWGMMQPIMAIVGVAYVVNLMHRIDEAEGSKEELQEVVAHETGALLSFMAGFGLTYASLRPLLAGKNSLSGKRHAFVAAMAMGGGLLAAFGISDDISYVVKNLLDKYPNGYAITVEAGDVLTDVTSRQTVKAVSGSLARPAARKGMAFLTREATEESMEASLRFTTRRMEKMVGRKFGEKIAKSCGKEALYLILKRGGWKGAAAAVAVLIDGPLPIGDIIAVGFAGALVYDVGQLALIVLEGYKLNEELNKRKNMPLAPDGLVITGPDSLIEATAGVTDPNELFTMAQGAANSTFEVHRIGDAGWEEWRITDGEITEMVIYDMSGDRIAGITDEDLDEIIKAEEEASAAAESNETPSEDEEEVTD
jgi:hypothetical protein